MGQLLPKLTRTAPSETRRMRPSTTTVIGLAGSTQNQFPVCPEERP
jgi:hypothetical protein